MKLKIFLVFTLIFLLIGSVGIVEQVNAENILEVAKHMEAEGFDPHKVPAHSSIQLYMQVYEGLVSTSNEGDIVPQLAESWEIIDDTTYLFNLREGVLFHNGREMVAEDIKFSFERILDPETASIAKSNFEMVESVEIVDDYTVIFHLENAYADFFINLAHVYSAIVPREVIEEHGDLMNHMVGTGPFKLDTWNPDNYTLLVKNEDYYIDGQPAVDGIRYSIMTDESSRMAALRSGTVHMTSISPEAVQILEGTSGLDLVEYSNFDYTYLAFNVTEEPFDNPLVREAMSYAIDRELLAEIVFDGMAGVTGPVPPAQQIWAADISEFPSYQYDPNKAQELLAEAGYEDGLKFEITTSTAYDYMVDTAVILQEILQAANVEVEIKLIEWGTYIDTWVNRTHQSLIGLNGAGRTPDRALYFFFHSTGAANVWGFSDSKFDTIVEAARVEIDQENRQELYHEAQLRLVNELAPNLFLNTPSQFYAVNEVVSNFNPTPYQAEGQFKLISLE